MILLCSGECSLEMKCHWNRPILFRGDGAPPPTILVNVSSLFRRSTVFCERTKDSRQTINDDYSYVRLFGGSGATRAPKVLQCEPSRPCSSIEHIPPRRSLEPIDTLLSV